MVFLYNFGIRLYGLVLRLAALKSSKAKAWISGRTDIFNKIKNEIEPGKRYTWFHFASLGEFEQGRTVLEKIKALQPQNPILITFFSPSGYEIRKNSPLADHVFYLPVDTQKNAAAFIRLINPSMAIFTKYEYWFHYFNELKKKQIPLYIISAIFRENQPFFKWYGGLHRRMLSCVTHFFVQNEESKNLLKGLSFENVSVSGDTRFDRVYENAQNPRQLNAIKDFCGDAPVFIAGSTWPADEKLLSALPAKLPGWKFIIAPHEIGENHIGDIGGLFSESIRYSNLQPSTFNFQTLIIDNIGMLSSLYQYGDVAYIGGGFGAGIHNTLEAAAFGLPVIFGSKYQKFKEAKDLTAIGAAFAIADQNELYGIADEFKDGRFRQESGNKARRYVEENIGATNLILNYISDQGEKI